MATTIKVDKAQLISVLQGKLAEQDNLRAEYKKAEDKYKKALKAFTDRLIALVKSGKLEVSDTNYRSWRDELELTIKTDSKVLPPEPEKPKYPDAYINDSDYEELRRTIRLLSMTNDPTVPAGVYRELSKWI